MDWCTIESDPGVFSELINTVGVRDVKVEELYDLDGIASSENVVHGLIFLFKWKAEKDDREILRDGVPGLFFAKQVINNACATQAVLSVLLNAEVELGEVLGSFKEFTADFPPDMKGEAIGNCQPLREAHNSFARPEPFDFEAKEAKEDDDVFHFISYVPYQGAVYELDGLKAGPIKLSDIPENGSWLLPVTEIIKARINKYVASEIRFNLLEVTKDMKGEWKARIAEIEKILNGDGPRPMETGPLERELSDLKYKLSVEEEKFKGWHDENIRRRHNYIPFLMNTLKTLAERGHLVPLLENAEEKKKAKK